MSRIPFLSIFCATTLSLANASFAQGWFAQTSGVSNTLEGVSFISRDSGFVVGSGGAMLRTTDGGATWTAQSSGTTKTLHWVAFRNAEFGNVVGDHGVIRQTIDGGTTWTAQTSGTINALYEIFYVSPNISIAVGVGGKILRTINAGATWTSQPSGTTQTLFGVFFSDSATGTAVGGNGTIRRTTNAGSTWTGQSSGTSNILFQVCFFGSDTGLAVGANGTIICTTNGGTTWTSQVSGTTQSLFGEKFLNANTGFVVGAGGTILRTTNGGMTWTSQASGSSAILYEVHFTDANTGTAVGSGGTILRTTTGGVSEPPFSVSPTTLNFADVLTGSNKQDSVTVTNTGTSTLTITSVASDNGEYSVMPATGSVPPSSSQKFYITFSPTNSGAEAGNIIFTHDASGSPDSVSVSGTGVQAGFSVAPTAVLFGDVTVGSSKQDSVMVTNTGTSTLTISLVSSDNGEFNVMPATGSVPPSSSQKFYITFSPTNSGAEAGNIIFTHDASGSPDSVTVSGTGVELGFSVVPGSVTFGNVTVGSSMRDSVTVTNTGTSTLMISLVTSDNGEFSVTPATGSIPPSSSQKFYITFSPTNIGAEAGNIIFTHDASGSPDSVTINGTGVQAGFSVTPTGVSFGNVTVGSSMRDSVTVTNTGTSTLMISLVTSDNGEFSVMPTTGSVPPSSSEKFYITFSPTNSGPETGNIIFAHDASGSPDSVALSGTGVEPGFSIAPGSVAFGNVTVGSGKQDSVTVTNTGTSTLTISSVSLDNGEFSVMPTTGSVPPSSSEKFYITFSPTNSGPETGNIIFTHDASGSPDSVAVSGTGVQAGFSVAPISLSFGNVIVGSFKQDSVAVTNTGTSMLMISSVTSNNGEFSVTPTTGSIPPSSSQKFYITFSPTNSGAETGNIIFTHDASSSPDSVTVGGTGVEPGFSVAPTAVSFGNVTVGSNKQDSVTVTNTGTLTLTITSVASDNGEFSVSPTGGSVPPALSQKFYIMFNPTVIAPAAGNIIFAHTASSSPDTVTVAGTGEPLQVVVPLSSGWEMISNPVTTPNDSVRQLYPTSEFEYAYALDGPYHPVYRLENGKGYWEKFSAPVSSGITGYPRTRDTVDVTEGWTMVGSISYSVDTIDVVSIPSGLRVSNWIGYSGAYSPVSQIVPGKGYWVKAQSAGQFVFSSSGSARISKGAAPSGTDVLGALHTLTIADSRGAVQTLYLGVDANDEIPLALYDMPPLPPVGALDARFETRRGGSMVRTHTPTATTNLQFPIRIQADAFPLTLAWNIRGTASYVLTDGLGGGMFQPQDMRVQGTMKITNPDLGRLIVQWMGDGQSPRDFALLQNYPNPFNPTTNIKYALPVDSKVTAHIYNVLGQRVRTLVNGDMSAGYHIAEWDGTGNGGQRLASGVYFLQLSATGANGKSFSEVRKLMMMK